MAFLRNKKNEINLKFSGISRQKRVLGYQVANVQGQGAREYQEDAFSFVNALDVGKIREQGFLAVVADGMGGMKGGREAGERTISCLIEAFKNMIDPNRLQQMLYESIMHANSEVYRLLDGQGGSTVAACAFYDEQLYAASVGDSYIYLKRGQQLCRVNRPHNIKTEVHLEEIRAGRFSPEKGRQDPEAEALSSFIGMQTQCCIDMLERPLPLRGGDTILICSDGVAGELLEDEIKECLEKEKVYQMCDALEAAIIRKNLMYQDNYTALVIRCTY